MTQISLPDRSRHKRRSRFLFRLLSVLSILAVWIIGSRIFGSTVLPGPLDTLAFLLREYDRGALFFHIGATMNRVLIAFLVAMPVGVLLGAAMGFSRAVDSALEAWLVTGLTIPRILLFVMAYLLLGLNEQAAILALIITIVPTIVAQLREGARALDGRLLEMAHAFHRSRMQVWTGVIIPQLMPYILGTARTSLALAWKMVVLAELIGRTSGVGYQISFYFQMFNMRGILAYGLAMMLILAAIDIGIMNSLERYVFRWRGSDRLAT
jgi:NitT/TauT family transport system permease protein